MVQNQMTPTYPQFPQQPGLEEYQQTPTAAAPPPQPDQTQPFKPDQNFTAQPVTVANGVEQQTVSTKVLLKTKYKSLFNSSSFLTHYFVVCLSESLSP
jgi:hypothetical protein